MASILNPGRKIPSWAVSALLILAVGLAYSNTLNSPFTLDDLAVVLGNPTVMKLWPLGPFQEVVSNYPYLNQIIYVRPVSNFLFALNHAVSGTAPWSYHVVNLALHVCNTLLVFAILRRTLRTPLLVERFGDAALGLAAGGALLWGLHPLLTNAVTYVMPRMEMTMALFYLLTLYAWIRGAQDHSRLWLSLAAAACFLGMMSKESMLTAPLMVLLYDGLFLANSWREALRRRWPWYIGLLLSMVWLVFLIEHVPGSGGLLGNPTAPSANERGAVSDRWSYAATMPGVILYYLRLLAWPDPLIFDYKWPVANSWSAILLPGSLIAAGAAAAAWGLLRRQPWAYPIAWYLIALLPSSSLMPLYDDYIAEFRAYLPSIGPLTLVLLLAWHGLAQTGWTRTRRLKSGLVTGALVLLVLGSLTYIRNNDYRTEIALWSDTVRKAPHNERARLSLGAALGNAGRTDEAIAQYREVLRLAPSYFLAHTNLALSLADKGLWKEAEEQYDEVLRRYPRLAQAHVQAGAFWLRQRNLDKASARFNEAVRLDPRSPKAHNGLGVTLNSQGARQEAELEFREALRLDPNFIEARRNLGQILWASGREAEGAHELREALRLDPTDAEARATLAALLGRQGRKEEAVKELRESLRHYPDIAQVHLDLGTLLAELNNLEAAEKEMREALRLDPSLAVARNNLGVILGMQGRRKEAEGQYREALRLKPDYADAENNLKAVLHSLASTPEQRR